MNYENLKLNYLELSFISGVSNNDKLSTEEAKSIFRKILNLPEEIQVKRTDEVEVKVLKTYFKPVFSIDPRYDGMNSLIFCLRHKSKLYRNYLSNNGVIKKGSLIGGKSILWKIMSDKEKEHFYRVITPKHEIFKRLNGIIS